MAEAKTDKKQALELAIATIERQFGKGSVMRLGANGPLEEIAVIPTGALSLDVALGVGGVPRGRVVEIYGPESSGKTTLALHVVSEAQRLGGIAAFIDAEHALDPIYAKKLGVNTDELLISQPDTGEQALEITETLVRSNAVDVIVIDSVAALVPRAELDGDMGDSLPGLQARLMSQALRKLTSAISRSGVVMIFINQIREKIGVMFGCLHHDTLVMLADGTREMIGRIVKERRPVDVLSYDPKTGQIVPRRVVNWFDNGPAEFFIQFEVRGGPGGPARRVQQQFLVDERLHRDGPVQDRELGPGRRAEPASRGRLLPGAAEGRSHHLEVHLRHQHDALERAVEHGRRGAPPGVHAGHRADCQGAVGGPG